MINKFGYSFGESQFGFLNKGFGIKTGLAENEELEAGQAIEDVEEERHSKKDEKKAKLRGRHFEIVRPIAPREALFVRRPNQKRIDLVPFLADLGGNVCVQHINASQCPDVNDMQRAKWNQR